MTSVRRARAYVVYDVSTRGGGRRHCIFYCWYYVARGRKEIEVTS